MAGNEEESKSSWHPSIEQARELVRVLLEGSPETPAERLTAMAVVKQVVMQQLADQLAPALQALIEAMPHNTRQEKQAICTFVNAKLRELGLAVRCPNTGKPGLIAADHKQAGSEISRFRWEIHDDAGKRTRTASSTEIPTLELCPDEPRKEGLVEWTKRANQNNSRNSGRE